MQPHSRRAIRRSPEVDGAINRSSCFWDDDARHDPGPDPGRFVRSPGESVAAVSVAQLPHLGPQRTRTSLEARSDSAISCRTSCRCSMRSRICAVHISCWRPRGSSSRGTSSTGGIRRPDAERARDVRTICCGCRTPRRPTSHTPAMSRCSTRSCRFSRRRRSSLGRPRYTACHRSRRRAVRSSSMRFAPSIASLKYGAHGLPLIGSGDWNDGMNRVGHQGRGESVWLGWFLVVILKQWALLCDQRRDIARAQHYRSRGAVARRHAGARLGRQLVPTRVFRRRNPSRIGAERGVPYRLADAVVGRPL